MIKCQLQQASFIVFILLTLTTNAYCLDNKVQTFIGNIDEVGLNFRDITQGPSAPVRITLKEFPKTFHTNLGDAVSYGLVTQEPMKITNPELNKQGIYVNPLISEYKLLDSKGWRVKITCDDDYNISSFEILKKAKKAK